VAERAVVIVAAELSSGDLVAIIGIVVLLLASAFLALAETSLTSVSRTTAAALVEEGRRGANRLSRLIDEPERFLNPVLLLLLVGQLFEAVVVGVLAYRLFGGWGVVIASVINVVIVFVFTEAAPKTWAREHPVRAALFAARPVATIVTIPPIGLVSRALIGLTNVLLPGKGLKQGPFVSEAKLLALADAAVEEDVIEAEERELIEQIIEFGDTIVREVMVPRPDMITVPADFRVADVMEVAILNGYSRIPASGEGIDDVVGIVFAKDLMRAERDGGADREVSTLLRPVNFVPETKKVAELLREMQGQQFHMALVIDEYGGTAGLVTLEDLIEELVGEIVDEFDREEPTVEPLAGGGVRVNARMAVDEVNELLHAELPEGDWDTIGGLLLDRLGRMAAEGDTAEIDGFVLRADRVKGRRIGRVRIVTVDQPVTTSTERPASDERGAEESVSR
jgi:putative hemolysin